MSKQANKIKVDVDSIPEHVVEALAAATLEAVMNSVPEQPKKPKK
jgi:hypothetical protein